ncbi:MAG: Verru_Chthon cassette protein C [Chthoniobacteraceae bacterium]
MRGRIAGGFTLVELLVATAILVLILVMTVQITNYASNLMVHTQAKVDSFQEARAGFESMTRKISQAMLNTYWDYADVNGNPRTTANASTFVPSSYLRQSELQFITGQAMTSPTQQPGIFDSIYSTRSNSVLLFTTHAIFFQAPLGYSSTASTATLTNLLNECGYFVEFSNDNTDRPTFLSGTSGATIIPLRYRFRLKELSVPTESSEFYTSDFTTFPPLWFTDPFGASPPLKRTIAENVIALIILPMRSPNDPAISGTTSYAQLAPHYAYDSKAWASTPSNPVAVNTDSSPLVPTMRNQLPPVVQVTMVAIDEPSAARLASKNGTTMPTFTDSNALPGGLSSIFQTVTTPSGISSGKYGDEYLTDLASLEKALVNQHMTYRVFSTSVSISQAKWSN